EDYCVWVELALAKIKKSELKKVVLSRIIEIELRKSFNPLVLFENLCNAFPNAFVSLVALPGVGTWIGATPELLMGIKNKALTTVSLAGTKPVAVNAEINWGDKEIVEQAIVSDYIKACFLQQNINHFTEEGPTTVQIGNLVHLQTKFSLKLSSDNLTIDVNRLLHALHPTPAVCGVPKQKAFRFIQEKESHNRELYSGFLGPVNLQEQSQLFVNLRCLQLQKSSAILYAGSGITKDSIPEQESFETELKLKALLNFLNNIPKTNESPNPFSEKYSVIDRILCDDRF
ncbi:MAG: isochorismate synthase, partial [bacterium]